MIEYDAIISIANWNRLFNNSKFLKLPLYYFLAVAIMKNDTGILGYF